MTDTPPSLARCLASLFYESLLIVAMMLISSAVLTPLQLMLGQDSWLLHSLIQLAVAGVLFAYFGYCWTRSGQTAAMKTWHIRLVRADGQLLGWPQALMRYAIAAMLFVGLPVISYLGWQRSYGDHPALKWLALLWWLVPFLSRFYDKDRRHLHDRLAGTRLLLLPKPARGGK
ncbi:RDD family protein [Chromobacterium sp. IIBBL 290-4]|uniref:RDD family protein n=1 Tax=Chromobacterium sp. IIBBL 290-4 TaxID=2953890 RepID=UPI0020B64462|nr:RDD family protein [Chromobacterium sp. IIBBL 290-4]UTH76282.1 RDD family protein [Chromobacterium sp. IIBBL 290-4]